MEEREIKLAASGPREVRALLRRLGWRVQRRRHRESNIVYDRPGSDWLTSGRLLRLRESGGLCRLTVKLPAESGSRHKVRREHEVEASDSRELGRILCALGFVPCWRYEKFRTCFQKPSEPGEIVYDETPVGDYLELEGPSRWIDRTARRLGFGLRDYLTASYRDLFAAHVEGKKNASADMLFGRRGMRRTPRPSR